MESYFVCKCGFKSVEGQIAKTDGACPRCGARTASMKTKYGRETVEQTDLHIKSKGGN